MGIHKAIGSSKGNGEHNRYWIKGLRDSATFAEVGIRKTTDTLLKRALMI